jgi:pimeloyl-ACP methyl ester carboxylesterase
VTSIWKTPAGGEAVRARYRQFLAHWPGEGARQLTVPTRHGETFVVASGPEDASALVLLHGSAATAAMWMADVGAWSRAFRVYAVDLIGEPGLSAEARPKLASGAYVEWLDDVLAGLAVERASLAGVSLGGWLALTYATARPERVEALVLLAPGGVGKQKNVLIWAAPLLLLGPWGRRQVLKRIGGPQPAADAPPAVRAFGEFMGLIFKHFRPRTERLPGFSDAALQRLTMPVLAVLGAHDAFIDSAGTKRRLEANLPRAEVRWLPDAGHFLTGQTQEVLRFLQATRP